MEQNEKKHKAHILPVIFFGWLIPGMGHIWLGEVKRGVIIFAAINLMFWGGVALGGVMTVDRVYQEWWFYGQMFCGLDSAVSWYRSEQVYKELSADDDIRRIAACEVETRMEMGFRVKPGPVITPSPTGRPDDLQMAVDQKLAEKGIALVRPVDEVARGFTGIAGLLNLICIFDAVMIVLIGRSAGTGEAKEAAA